MSKEYKHSTPTYETKDSKVKKHLKLPAWETKKTGSCKGQK